ncbi:hypothetical protein HYDPIDRAFT_37230 [Hydnomerulius pinastri MD-312]|nr:hypothetical protein HYDPIDRAFT_37230 [Hydnomerulius pinastri MD-312]
MTALSIGFLPIPSELTEHALTLCHPRDVASFSQTCRKARLLVYSTPDQYLWRQLFLLYPFDDPRKAQQGYREDIHVDWKMELQERIRAEIIARSSQSTSEERIAALQIFLNVARDASPVTRGYERVPSPNLLWVVDILQSTNMLRLPTFSEQETSQTLARLRSYLALTLDDCDDEDEEGKLRMKSMRTKSRCLVYDLRNYRRDNDWGPFLTTGEVDWVHVECIINVISSNLVELGARWADTRPPCGLEATRANSAPDATTRAPHDWAGVEGSWRRYVSFMDYRDLFAFNFSGQGRRSRDGSFFEDANFAEATRLIELKLHLISSDAVPNFYTLDRFPDCKDSQYPTLYFSGTSWGVHGNEATVVGSVCMADDGVVRWRFQRKASVYEAHMQWSSEGVQIGGVASATGVVGTWTGAHHEHGDPVGPFWLWKVTNDHRSHMRHLLGF